MSAVVHLKGNAGRSGEGPFSGQVTAAHLFGVVALQGTVTELGPWRKD